MDGSIADSTVLRMRTQLQRMHHAAPAAQADGFLEELLKLPASPPVSDNADTAQPADDAEDALPIAEAIGPGNDSQVSDEKTNDKSAEDDVPTPIVPVCYAPAAIPMPQEAERAAEVQVAEAPPTIQSPIAQRNPVDVEQTQPVTVPEAVNSPTVVDEASQPVAAPPSAIVPPIESKVAAPPDSRVKGLQARRQVDARAKVEAKGDEPQAAIKDAATPTTVPIPGTAERAKPDQATADERPSAPLDTEPQSERPSEAKSDRNEKRPQRDKWYEGDAKSSGVQSASSADRLPADPIAADNQASATDEQTPSAPAGSIVASDSIVVPPDVSAQTTLDNGLMASDLAVAAQANVAQSVNSQRVNESSASAQVDGAGRGSQALGGSAGGGSQSTSSGLVRTVTANATANSAGRSTSSTGANEPDQPREITQQERVRLVQRVARSFSRLGPEGGQVTLKLHPPQLGVLNVSIKIDGQSMTARLQTETGSARDAIIESLPVLRERLSEQGIEIEKFQVEVGQQDSGSNSGQMNSFAGNHAGSQQNDSSRAGEIDYRRLARANAARQNMGSHPVVEPKLQGWSVADRSLDVRA